MRPYFIGIAGGSGAGKSTLAYGLLDYFGNRATMLHFDDYQMAKLSPVTDGLTNWDHPDAIAFDQLIRDLASLQADRSISVMTKDQRVNPDFQQTGRIAWTIKPCPVVIVEGYLVLWHPKVRRHFSRTYYLDASSDLRLTRRTKFLDDIYRTKILEPMHQQYVEPTKLLADIVIDITNLRPEEVLQSIIDDLRTQSLLINTL